MSNAEEQKERCVFCKQFINDHEDAQRIERRKYAHTKCAFAVNNAFLLALDMKC